VLEDYTPSPASKASRPRLAQRGGRSEFGRTGMYRKLFEGQQRAELMMGALRDQGGSGHTEDESLCTKRSGPLGCETELIPNANYRLSMPRENHMLSSQQQSLGFCKHLVSELTVNVPAAKR
jgi:hypothetical protein